MMTLEVRNLTKSSNEPKSEVSSSRGKTPLPLSLLREFFSYDESSPSGLVWKKLAHTRAKKKVGEVAGCWKGVWEVRVKGQGWKAHRVVWALHHGDPGELEIDHIDRDPSNNRIENLRLATRQQNGWNRGKGRRGKHSQHKGVTFHKGRWRMKAQGVDKSFQTETEAALFYNELVLKKHGEFAVLNTIEKNK